MPDGKTPNVFDFDNDSFGGSVIEVPTDVPVFIGYTEKADNAGRSLLNTPQRITSLNEYVLIFGRAPKYQFILSKMESTPPDDIFFDVIEHNYGLRQTGERYSFYNSLRLFFENGGGACHVVSVGSYEDAIDKDKLIENGLRPLLRHAEPTMIVVPEAIHLNEADCVSLQQAVLSHCATMKSRVGILDVYNGYRKRNHPDGDVIGNFRDAIGADSLSYGAVYYPWLHTSIVSDTELGISNLTNGSLTVLKDLLMEALNVPTEAKEGESSKTTEIRDFLSNVPKIHDEGYDGPEIHTIDRTLNTISPAYSSMIAAMKGQLNLLAPSAAMAGIYTKVDNDRGVWASPANIALSAVIRPAVSIANEEGEDLNIGPNGKSINAIRAFRGKGNVVWGARTLEGSSQEWRFISVRRTMIMLEQSIKIAVNGFAFSSNDTATWSAIKSKIEIFLRNLWAQGALAGGAPGDAFSVRVGIGSTMTIEDVQAGILKVEVLVAIARPAEFLEITFQQHMPRS